MGKDQDMEWLVKDMSNELKVWGRPGGAAGNIILKSDGEPAMLAVRDALAKYHGKSYKKGQLQVTANRMNLSRRPGKRSGSLRGY